MSNKSEILTSNDQFLVFKNFDACSLFNVKELKDPLKVDEFESFIHDIDLVSTTDLNTKPQKEMFGIRNKNFRTVTLNLSYAKHTSQLNLNRVRKLNLQLPRTQSDAQRQSIVEFIKQIKRWQTLSLTIELKAKLDESHCNLILHMLTLGITKLGIDCKARALESLSKSFKAKFTEHICNLQSLKHIKVTIDDHTERLNLVPRNESVVDKLDTLLGNTLNNSNFSAFESEFMDDIEIH
jgi:hypothetical protein